MIYITVKQSPQYHQMTIEELLFDENPRSLISENTTNTRTYVREELTDVFKKKANVEYLVKILSQFNYMTDHLRECERSLLYEEFYIPKRSGGLRRIDAPKKPLMDALRELKSIFENNFHAMYHTSAFAYVNNRSTVDVAKKHQLAGSKWFAQLDLHNFFGSVTLEYTMKMLAHVFPFSEVIKDPEGRKELETALDLAFLNGGLPQGTPISPLITNVIMIPVDYTLNKELLDFDSQKFVYTRYADDFQISSKYDFDVERIESLFVDVLEYFGAPFKLNTKKTRYGSNAGSNWMLGVMLNKDNNITVGYKNKRIFKSMLSTYIMDKKNGKKWEVHDIQVMEGHRNYYRMVEPDTIDGIVEKMNEKYKVDVLSMIKDDLKVKKNV